MPHYDWTPLAAEVLWLATHKTSIDGRSCRAYQVMDAQGNFLLVARAFNWSREMKVSWPDGQSVLGIIRSRAFPFTGRAAVQDLPAGSRLGTVSRNGSFRDASGSVYGKFTDARTLSERTKESLLQGGLDALLGMGGDAAAPSGPHAFVLQGSAGVAGTLSYGRLPFAPAAEPASAAPRTLPKWAPQRLRSAWTSINAPRGWKFQRTVQPGQDPRLLLAAALFTAELARW
jgi:hypothetical protein